MTAKFKRKKRGLPVVCFNNDDELTVETYLAKAKAQTGQDYELSESSRKEIEYTLRVFKGMKASQQSKEEKNEHKS